MMGKKTIALLLALILVLGFTGGVNAQEQNPNANIPNSEPTNYVTELEDGAQYRIRNADTNKYLTISSDNVFQYDYQPDGNQIITYQQLSNDAVSLGFGIDLYGLNLVAVPWDMYDSWTIQFLPDERALIWNNYGGHELGTFGTGNGDNGWLQEGDICLNISDGSTDYIYWHFEEA